MARRPFFSGNYGSALGSTANAANLIARAGEQRGQMMANMGAQIGGMIQQYGLNKEKQKENKATIKSSIGILQRMSKIDEANAPQYMAQIQQLENEDVPLSQRGMLADKTLQGLSITNQLQGQMLSNQAKQQALGLARQLEASTIENAKLQNTNLGIRNALARLTERKGQAVTEAEIKSILSNYGAEEEIRPSQTAAKKATNELSAETAKSAMRLLPKKERASDVSLDTSIKTDQAKLQTLPSTTDATIADNLLSKASAEENLKLLPQRTQLTEEQIKTDLLENQVRQDSIPEQAELDAQKRQVESRKLDVENEFMDIVGIKNYAKMKADDLKTMSDINKAKYKQTLAAAEYYTQKGMADLITAANKASPSFKDSYAPILEMQGKLLTTKVVVPGSKERITLEDYLKEHDNDKGKYPLNGLPGHLHGLLLQFEKSGQDLINSQTVQVNVPDANQAQGSQAANQSDLLQAMENIPSVRANREANIRKSAELGKERREIFDDPNSNIYLY